MILPTAQDTREFGRRLADAHLEIRLERGDDDESRSAELVPVGGTWQPRLRALVGS